MQKYWYQLLAMKNINISPKSLKGRALVVTFKEPRLPLVTAHFNMYYTITSYSCKRGTEKIHGSLLNIQQMSYSKEFYLSVHTCTCKIDADNQLHNCICGALSTELLKNILA